MSLLEVEPEIAKDIEQRLKDLAGAGSQTNKISAAQDCIEILSTYDSSKYNISSYYTQLTEKLKEFSLDDIFGFR